MVSGSIALRPAQPTRAEGVAFAHYLNTAADGFFRLLLGSTMPEIVAAAFAQPGHDPSHEYVTFAVSDGSVVGMGCGFTADQHRRSSDEPLVEAAGPIRALRMAMVGALGRRVLRFIDAGPEGDFYLEAVAVDDGARRLYERRGLRVEAESPRMPLAPGMRALRMVKDL